MSVLGAVSMGRVAAEARMTETFRVYEVTGTTVDPENDLNVVDVEVDRYSGPGRLAFRSSVVSDVDVGSQLVAVQSARMDLPVSVGTVGTGMFAVVTGSLSDVSVVGRRFRVEGMPQAGQTTAHRFSVVEVT
jgi:hypothetical protein